MKNKIGRMTRWKTARKAGIWQGYLTMEGAWVEHTGTIIAIEVRCEKMVRPLVHFSLRKEGVLENSRWTIVKVSILCKG